MIDAICKELELRKTYLSIASFDSIYFGGGTPSLLTIDELNKVLDKIYCLFKITEKAEITLEANPDDLSMEKLLALKDFGINRLSIGVQSFQNKILTLLNRAHSAQEAVKCIGLAREAGFDQISLDLIFSIPGQSDHDLMEDLQQAIALYPEHISVYGLTIEEKTVFGNWLKKGRFLPVSDEASASQFELLIATLERNGYEQYEVSNFCRNEHYARHNTSYWKNITYLGVGPGAHSYNGIDRQHNVANNHLYMKSLAQNIVPFDLEHISQASRANEFIMTSLRTKWGCNLHTLHSLFGYDLLAGKSGTIERLKNEKLVLVNDNMLYLSKKGIFLADDIIADLFWIP